MEATIFLRHRLEAQSQEVANAEVALREAKKALERAQIYHAHLNELLTEAAHCEGDEAQQEDYGASIDGSHIEDDENLKAEGRDDSDAARIERTKRRGLKLIATRALKQMPEETAHLDEIVTKAYSMGFLVNKTSLQSMLSRNRDTFYPLSAGTGQWTLADSQTAHSDRNADLQNQNKEFSSSIETSMSEIVEMENRASSYSVSADSEEAPSQEFADPSDSEFLLTDDDFTDDDLRRAIG